MTGGRLGRLREHLGEKPFCMTYGDGVTNLNIGKLVDFHFSHGRTATVTAVRPPSRFGALAIEDGVVSAFTEKPLGDGLWINGGFFVLSPKIFDYIEGDDTTWEQEPLRNLAHAGQLNAFKHDGFWQPMDTLRDRNLLETLWNKGTAPWKVWN